MSRYKLFILVLLLPLTGISQVKVTTADTVQQTQIYESLLMKNYTKKLVKAGDVRGALDLLIYTLPDNLENPSRPLVPETLDQLYNVHYNEDHNAEILESSLPGSANHKFSDDGAILAGINANGKLIYLYHTIAKRNIANISSPGYATDIAFSDGGKKIYIQFLQGQIAAVSLDDYKTTEFPIQDTVNINKGINVSPDGSHLVTYGNKMAKVYNLKDYMPVSEFAGYVKLARFVPGSSNLFIVLRSGEIVLYDFEAKRSHKFSSLPSAETAALSHCGNYIALIPKNTNGIIELWNAQTGTLVVKRKAQNYITDIEFSNDDSKIFVASIVELRSVGGVPEISQMWHNHNILDLKISKDNKYIATGGVDSTARIWYASNGKPVCPPLMHKRKTVRYVDFSPCGKYLITLPDDDNKVHIWDVATGQELPSNIMVKKGKFFTAEFSSCGNYILTTSNNVAYSCLLWDFKTQRITYPLLPHQGGVFYATFSDDGKYVATSSAGFKAKVWKIKDHKSKYNADLLLEYTHTQNIRKLVFSPDNSKLAFFGTKDPAATVLSINDGYVIGKDFRHKDNIMDVAFSKNGKLLATGSMDSVAVIWNIETGKPAVEPIRHKGKTGEVKFFSNDKYLAVACWNGYAAIWDTSTGKLAMPNLKHTNRVSSIAFSTDEKFMVTASLDRSAKIWKFISPSQLLEFHHKSKNNVAHKVNLGLEDYKAMYYTSEAEIALESKDTSKAVSLLLDVLPDNLENPNKKLSVDALQFLAKAYNVSHSSQIDLGIKNASIAKYSSDGKLLAAGTSDGKIYLYNADSYSLSIQLQEDSGIEDVVITDGNTHMAILLDNGNIKVYDIAQKKYIGKKMSHKGASKLVLSQNGDKVATYPYIYVLLEKGPETEKKVKIWDVSTGKMITETTSFNNGIASVSFSANDEAVLVTSPAENAKLYDANNCRKLIHSIPPVNYAPQGEIACRNNYLVTVNKNEIRVSSFDDGYLAYEPIILPGTVAQVTISPDGKYMAVLIFNGSGIDPSIRFYDITTGKPALYPIKITSRFWGIHFTDAPDKLLVKGDDIQLWDINMSVPVTAPLSSAPKKAIRENSAFRNGTNELVFYNKDLVVIRKMTLMQEIIDFYRNSK